MLIVEDDPALLEAMSEILLLAGHDVRSANNGEKGLKLLGEKEYELLLVDVLMPGMTGIEVAQTVRKNEVWNGIPILFASASTTLEHEGKIFSMDKTSFLRKPFSAESLVEAVAKALKEDEKKDE